MQLRAIISPCITLHCITLSVRVNRDSLNFCIDGACFCLRSAATPLLIGADAHSMRQAHLLVLIAQYKHSSVIDILYRTYSVVCINHIHSKVFYSISRRC